MKITKLLGICFSVLLIVGCISATYMKPNHVDKKENYVTIVQKDYDQVWKQLIEYSATTFFSIDNYEKDSGLITLSFGSSKPSEFITGGQWETTGSVNFNGDYVDYLTIYRNGRLNGKMNIVISKISENETRVTVNARYIFSTPSSQQVRSLVWSFDTGNCGKVRVANPAMGTEPFRTMCPTYKAEKAIINAVK
jgi:hypothetical protein